jgi:hypothetical protein
VVDEFLVDFKIAEGLSPICPSLVLFFELVVIDGALVGEDLHEFLGVEVSQECIEFDSALQIGGAAHRPHQSPVEYFGDAVLKDLEIVI